MSFVFDLVGALFSAIERADPEAPKGVTLGKLGRSFLAAAAMIAGAWLPAIEMDRPYKEAGATLVAMFFCSPAALLLAYPLGYFGSDLGKRLADRLGIESARWVPIGIGIILLGLAAGAVPWGLLLGGCTLALYLGLGRC